MKKVGETLGPNMANFTAVADEDEILRRYEANFSSVYMGIVFDITTSGKDLRYESEQKVNPEHKQLSLICNKKLKVQDPDDVGRFRAQLPDART